MAENARRIVGKTAGRTPAERHEPKLTGYSSGTPRDRQILAVRGPGRSAEKRIGCVAP
jgi:hypothetical protein